MMDFLLDSASKEHEVLCNFGSFVLQSSQRLCSLLVHITTRSSNLQNSGFLSTAIVWSFFFPKATNFTSKYETIALRVGFDSILLPHTFVQ